MRLRFEMRLLRLTVAFIPALSLAASHEPAPPVTAASEGAQYWAKPRAVATHGAVLIDGRRLSYTADAGTIILRDKNDKPTGEMFYVAYFKDGAHRSKRPIAFLYNGGPGGCSAPLHIGAFGPVRVVTNGDSQTPPAPYRLVSNDESLLDASDLVFVDAMGTGFSRILGKSVGGVGMPKMFYGVDPDARSFEQFIVAFLSQYGRWNSPKYLIGESYGTTRSAALAYLLERNDSIDVNGIVLMSTILDFGTATGRAKIAPGTNLPFALALPSYAAVGWYQKALPNRPESLHSWLDEVQSWAMGPYLKALDAGAALSPSAKQRIAAQMAADTGLPQSYILQADLRVTGAQFEHQLLLVRGETTGRLDGRFSGPTLDPLGEFADYDPQLAAIGSAYVSGFNDYVRSTLHFGGEHRYSFLSPSINRQWDHDHLPPGETRPGHIATNVMPDLAAAMDMNPQLKVMVNAGYFDLATPYYAAVYQMQQLPIQAALEKNVEFRFYDTGHMIYVGGQALAQLHDNIVEFIRSSEGVPVPPGK
ncbi:MAG: S10 family peptidase [Steroidobacteraceae bacterium]